MAINYLTRPEPAAAGRPGTSRQNEDLVALVARCASGDPAALTRLYEVTSPWIYGFLRRRTSSTAKAEDAAVVVYSQVWRQATSYPRHRQSVLAWMTAIACEAAANTESKRVCPM
jgi:RNA polymerase sigma-70 factor (ECF subfamily)